MRRIAIVVVLLLGLSACHEAAHATAAPHVTPTVACAQPVLPASMTSATANGSAIAQPGGHGAITVTAIGFTQSLEGMLSIGAEVSNSGTRIAYGTSLIFQAFDPSHRPVLDRQTVTIPVLLPGARVPVGLPSTGTADLAWAGYPKVRSVRATLLRTRWLPTTGIGEFPRMSVHLVPPLINIGGERLVTEAVLAGNTNACTSEPATRAAILYRNHSNAIFGGAIATTADASGVVGFSGCMVGGFHGGVYAYGRQPKTADLSRTEVALYCDPGSTELPTSRTMQ